MLRRTLMLTAALLLSVTVATPATAQNQAPAAPPPPMECTINTGTVKVKAVPGAGGSFPAPAVCPANTLGATQCLKWTYEYTRLSGNNISLSAVTVDADVDIVAATSGSPEAGGGMKVYDPGSSDSAIGGLGSGVYDFRTVRFASQGAVVLGHVYTRANVGTGSVTVAGKVGNTSTGTCQIAGADNIEGSSVGLAAVTTSQTDQFQECTITLTLDAKGCPTDVQATSTVQGVTCTVSEISADNFNLNGKKLMGGKCGNSFTTEGSTCTWYCPTSYGSCFQVCR